MTFGDILMNEKDFRMLLQLSESRVHTSAIGINLHLYVLVLSAHGKPPTSS